MRSRAASYALLSLAISGGTSGGTHALDAMDFPFAAAISGPLRIAALDRDQGGCMAKWNESNRRWEPDETLLSDAELAQCTRACDDDRFQTPIPTQMVSNGEYMPLPQSEQQKRVEARVAQLAEGASQQLGLSRRGFLATAGGMAASFIAMNEVFGPY